jgi:hypothetical protein
MLDGTPVDPTLAVEPLAPGFLTKETKPVEAAVKEDQLETPDPITPVDVLVWHISAEYISVEFGLVFTSPYSGTL